MWLDQHGRYIYVSPACERITGYRAETFLENSDFFLSIVHPEDRLLMATHFSEEQKAKSDFAGFDFRIINTAGEERWLSHYCLPVKSKDGQDLGRRISNRDITERKQAEQKVAEALKEKEILLREIHHRVKNNMGVISSLLDLQGAQISDSSIVSAFNESKHRIKSMALVHDCLYHSENLAAIDVSEYVNRLIDQLKNSYAGLAFTVTTRIDIKQGMLLDITHSIPLALILTELYTNALKHAFPGGAAGAIAISLCLEEGIYTLVFSDNGTGIPEAVNPESTGTLGLQLVSLLTQQLDGTLQLDRLGGDNIYHYF